MPRSVRTYSSRGRRLLVAALLEDALGGERLEAGGEDGARDAEVDEEVVVAAYAVERVADDEQVQRSPTTSRARAIEHCCVA